MARVRSRDTGPERLVRSALHRRGLRFRKHLAELPGSPDVVFSAARVAVFIDGDFWHGYRFPVWKAALPRFWQQKIALNRARDTRNFRRLRGMGWTVIRVWQHASRNDIKSVVDRIARAVAGKTGSLDDRANLSRRAIPRPRGGRS